MSRPKAIYSLVLWPPQKIPLWGRDPAYSYHKGLETPWKPEEPSTLPLTPRQPQVSWAEYRAWDPECESSGECRNMFLHGARPKSDLAWLSKSPGKVRAAVVSSLPVETSMISGLGSPRGSELPAWRSCSVHLAPQLLLLLPQGQDDPPGDSDSYLNHTRRWRRRNERWGQMFLSLPEWIIVPVVIITSSLWACPECQPLCEGL